jgi:hypothetical protein
MQGLGHVVHTGPDRSPDASWGRRRRAASGSLRCFGAVHIVINTRRVGPRGQGPLKMAKRTARSVADSALSHVVLNVRWMLATRITQRSGQEAWQQKGQVEGPDPVSLVVSAIHLALIHLLTALMVGSPALMVGSDKSHTVRSCLTWRPSSAGLVWITVWTA